ncbi:hypothetical protein [Rhizobium laguerreae]|uniref:hypothetical protein n=1 Tax=Rhizobium laguerreae TaxID=1076926 RepID=UPI001C8FEA7C|nr:hypothetical protein [Rhizobium laguerreae]MBY3363754.1 hypothetical protein [Rhizobium laguerreae]
MLDKGVVQLATTNSPRGDAVQAPPLDSNRLFAFDLASGDDPHEHTLSDRTELVTITPTFTSTDALPYAQVLRGTTGTKKRIFERDYAFSVVKVIDNDDVASNPRKLTFDPPSAGSVYIEIQEA